MEKQMELKRFIRDIPDFPKPGILFRDITPLLADKRALDEAIAALAGPFKGDKIDLVAAVEARGFIFGAPLAYELAAGFVPIRKPGKLPAEKISASYTLEYGINTLEMHKDAIQPGQRVLLVDDVLATGGSAQAAAELIEKLGGKVVSIVFLVDITYLHGMDKLKGYEVFSLIKF